MNRLDFFKEMKTGFLETFNAMVEPVLQEDMAKMNEAADRLLGIQWFFLCDGKNSTAKMEQKLINKKPVLILKKDEVMHAYSGLCPSCSQLLHISVQEESCKCLYCDKQATFEQKEGSDRLVLTEYPIKKEKDGYYLALKI